MIKTKATGIYSISIDGGKSFINESKNIILDNYYNKSNFTTNMTLSIGYGSDAPLPTDTVLNAVFATSANEIGFDSLFKSVDFTDRVDVSYSRLFDLGTGHSNTIRELGINNDGLVSRSLLKSADGADYSILLEPVDHVVIRYTITYSIPKEASVFNLTINGSSVNASVFAVNAMNGAWGTTTIGKVINYDNIGVSSAGTWNLNAENTITGVNIVSPIQLTTNIANNGSFDITGTLNASTSELNQTFQQMLITSSGVNYITAPILINFDVPITKTSNDIITLSIITSQSPV